MPKEFPNVGDIICTKTRPDYTYRVTGQTDLYIELIDLADNEPDSLRVEGWTHEASIWMVKEAAPLERKQVGGDHYMKHKIQPWDIIDAYNLDFYAGNAIKYILRAPDKNGVEDLEKAKHYLEKMIERAKNVQQ